MQFRLIKTLVRTLRCDELEDGEVAEDDLRYSPVYHADRPNEFAVLFDLKLPLDETNQLFISYLAVFETAEEITDEFKKSHFPRVNAAAVAYPYLRAFVGQFSVLAGFNLHTLPIRNFVKSSTLVIPSSTSTQEAEDQ
jgi:preprotein translocase subunit SecB